MKENEEKENNRRSPLRKIRPQRWLSKRLESPPCAPSLGTPAGKVKVKV